MAQIELRKPSPELHASFMQSTAEWNGVDQDGASVFFAEKYGWDLADRTDFEHWVQLLNDLAKPDFTPLPGFVSQSTLWVVENGEYLGAVSLRHELGNDYLLEVGGHIGYGIRPSARRRGLAKFALAGSLEQARALGLSKVLITCSDSNIGSARTIESSGGVLESLKPLSEVGPKFGVQEAVRRYWINLQ
ncbi:GNAT family N-acetyltransferase [Glutamicibacter sp. AOP5-A2-18]|uniref:GNAT family N-acetyltransferase n=1 Tax=Glutamicibacter sp. AOP5-A2-18 TaxID=3457656 RepID=UPI004033C4B6